MQFLARVYLHGSIAVRIQGMMRSFLLFLLFVVPLQLSWGAVSTYCEHDTEVASHHAGHDEHKHQSDQPSKGDDPSTDFTSGSCGADCGVCHASCSTAVCDGTAPLSFAGAEGVFAPVLLFHPTLFSSKPTRPKWLSLA